MNISITIWEREKKRWEEGCRTLPDLFLVQVAALLHDVPDHKYDKNGILHVSMKNLLENTPILKDICKEVIWIVDNVSWSREVQMQGKNLVEHAYDQIGYARDIVSDADKSLAIGLKGYKRCLEYTLNKLDLDIDEDIDRDQEHEVRSMIQKIANDKLLRLLPEGYFRTESGIEIAEPLHEELVQLLDNSSLPF